MTTDTDAAVSQIADNPYVKIIERVLIALITLGVTSLWIDVNAMRAAQPVTQERLKNLEEARRDSDARALAARAERNTQYQTVLVELTAVKQQVLTLQAQMAEDRATLRSINDQLLQLVKQRPNP